MTHDSAFHDDLQASVKDLLSRQFTHVQILSVKIAEEFDENDNGIEITVTFKGTPEQLVSGRPPGMFEMVRAKLGEIGASAFPVFNFISLDARA